ncbi:protein-L-isoaspartate O-methyltransferase [Nocardiopsis terrae]|uniref:Protein-L-isoaspartate O-methyltransferase n=1 Tax=Nocardiopsis terrae TaxID=372655 RepID=A0ABR9HDM5_9ACTN|nr:methyltransferase domain-containing protein [Nocardiopsis terrae]MBE1457133.1 protein-L-isoaspartate(D-aspartate) O-methyltransferase [Nocardiopsis terrae]GHC90813.1 protein-L-isoaspartate O-methyltransferase [Nocardiopsis terrae]
MIPSHEKLVARLVQAGDLPQHWRAAFEQVERHRFLPDQITDADGATVDRTREADRWLTLAYDDIPVVTQLDDGTGDGSGYPTSSASQPSIVADMLRRLDVFPGMRALEVGTGTGYNAALLSHLLGDDSVTSIEVDPELAEQARVSLMSAGFAPLVVTGDGTQGWPARAPFDRVISTAAVQRVPYHWIAQTRPGGRILTPWGNAFHNGVLADLQVGPHGTAQGRFGGDAAFMWVRDQRVPRRVVETHVRPREQEFTTARTKLHPYEPVGDFEASFAIGLRMPTVLNRVEFPDEDEQRFTVFLVDPGTASWASWHIDQSPGVSDHEVRQHGPRALFAELEAAYEWWQRSGRPEHTRFGLTVSADRQQIWLDHEANTVTPDRAA